VAGTKYVARRCDDIVMVSQAVEGRKMQSGWMIEHFDPGSICRGSIKPGMIRGICMELSIGSFFLSSSNGCGKTEAKQGDRSRQSGEMEYHKDTSGERLLCVKSCV
jgi:hypothetical protein